MKKHSGQTLMEYMILLALLAVASIPIAKTLGDVFRDRMLNAADAIVDKKRRVDNQGASILEAGKDEVRKDMGNFFHR